uniref:Beta-galactosidase n=1 Tax=Ananas comosus var. bracteatus TaxID=296719 RepID=A0A6V7PJ10_ANACO|nr:unnamed protein product [Ananas comosus var. bracteatus]
MAKVSPETSLRLLAVLLLVAVSAAKKKGAKEGAVGVTYDGRSLMINGRRELLFSGSIHYPRSTPEMWPDLIQKSKHGGLNVIQTYVFWNVHEPAQGQYNFEGRYDLVKFIKLIQQHGMYATLRIGPFIQAEWNHGGLPYWLREVKDITFRTNNEPFKYHMQRFVEKIVQLMKDEKLFASQGGPIILSQIENEYNNIGNYFKLAGKKYIEWAGEMANQTNTGVPWVMCKQNNAPQTVINACNGRNCGDNFAGPNHPTKPVLWTENWTAQYRVFGDPPSQRSAEDLAFSVARFFSKNGTLANYYMYHGGTNFGRTGAAFVMPRYYDEAPLDEFGLYKEPKWGHLRDLHHALRLCRKGLLWGSYSVQYVGNGFDIRLYEKPESNVCVAFLHNNNTRIDGTVKFRGVEYFLPRHSISILPDCRTVVFNTQRVNAQHNSRTFQVAKQSQQNNKWQMYQEAVPKFRQTSVISRTPLELFEMTKDTTDYLWYTTSFSLEDEDLPMRRDIRPVIQIAGPGHMAHAFVNGIYVGSGHGVKLEKSFIFQKPMDLKAGINHVAILALTIGMPDSGALLEKRIAGVHKVVVQGLNTGTLDLSVNGWGHRVGLSGEKSGIHNEEGSSRVRWTDATSGTPITWYKRYFDAPNGNDPVALDLSSMGKGLVWVNGECIGRYWTSYHSPLGQPSQSVYHLPRAFLKPKNNFLVVFEEEGGKPEEILVMTVKRDNICTFVSEFHPAHIKSWVRTDSQIKAVAEEVKPKATLKCSDKKVINKIVFASFGNPMGICGNFTAGTCHSPQAKILVEKLCLGKRSCNLPVSHKAYGTDDSCPGTTSTLAVQAKCSRRNAKKSTE